MKAQTLAEAVAEAAQLLRTSSPSARLDAELLAQHVTGVTRAEVIGNLQRLLSEHEKNQLSHLLARRCDGEPIAYLIGHREFWSLDLTVSPATLIPRPDTELLVERALAHLPHGAPLSVADLGTGSGAIALAIAHERPLCRVSAIDQSQDALAIATDNAARLGLANVKFVAGDWFVPLAAQRFDVVVSNPPYIRADDPHLDAGDVRFEPRSALIAGSDGLLAIRHLIQTAIHHLVANGWLLLEHGFDQAGAVRNLLKQHGYTSITSHRDLAGHERITEGQRR